MLMAGAPDQEGKDFQNVTKDDSLLLGKFIQSMREFPCSFNLGLSNLDLENHKFEGNGVREPYTSKQTWKSIVLAWGSADDDDEEEEEEDCPLEVPNKATEDSVVGEDEDEDPLFRVDNLLTRAYAEVGRISDAIQLNKEVIEISSMKNSQNLVSLGNSAFLSFLDNDLVKAYEIVDALNELKKQQNFKYLKREALFEQGYAFYILCGARNNLSAIEILTFLEDCGTVSIPVNLILSICYRRCTHIRLYSEEPIRIDRRTFMLEAAKRLWFVGNLELFSGTARAEALSELAFLKYTDSLPNARLLSNDEWNEIVDENDELELCKKAVELEKENPSYNVLALAGQTCKYIDKNLAEMWLKKSIDIYPTSRAYHHLGNLYRRDAWRDEQQRQSHRGNWRENHCQELGRRDSQGDNLSRGWRDSGDQTSNWRQSQDKRYGNWRDNQDQRPNWKNSPGQESSNWRGVQGQNYNWRDSQGQSYSWRDSQDQRSGDLRGGQGQSSCQRNNSDQRLGVWRDVQSQSLNWRDTQSQSSCWRNNQGQKSCWREPRDQRLDVWRDGQDQGLNWRDNQDMSSCWKDSQGQKSGDWRDGQGQNFSWRDNQYQRVNERVSQDQRVNERVSQDQRVNEGVSQDWRVNSQDQNLDWKNCHEFGKGDSGRCKVTRTEHQLARNQLEGSSVERLRNIMATGGRIIRPVQAENEDIQKSLDCFKQAISLGNTNINAYHDYGLTLAQIADYDEAIKVSLQLVNSEIICRSANDCISALQLVGKCYALKANHAYKQTGTFETNWVDEAEKVFVRAISIAAVEVRDVPELPSSAKQLWNAFQQSQRTFKFRGSNDSRGKLFNLCKLIDDCACLPLVEGIIFSRNSEWSSDEAVQRKFRRELEMGNLQGALLFLDLLHLRPEADILTWQNSHTVQKIQDEAEMGYVKGKDSKAIIDTLLTILNAESLTDSLSETQI